uniref:Uncharacterized protein n=1 Tax=Cannabis sativa TaxID=3483 RepID=A0A803NUE2_CANSA
MVNTRRPPVAPSASSGLPQDPQTIDPDVNVPATTKTPMNSADVVNPAISTGTTNLATIAGQDGTHITMDLSNRPLPLREDPLQSPPTEGRILGEHLQGTQPNHILNIMQERQDQELASPI